MQHVPRKSIFLCLAAILSAAGRVGAQSQAPVPASDEPAYKIGGGVSAPVPVYTPEPEYTEEARSARFQGTVILFIVVDENGAPRNIKVVHPLGMGLDQKAVEAVNKWKFRPGMKDGNPVPVQATIEVNFRLLDYPWPGSKPVGWSIVREVFDLPATSEPPLLADAPAEGFPYPQRPTLIHANFDIDAQGHTHSVVVVADLSGNTDAVAAELGRWTFKPAKQRGLPIAVHAYLELRYAGPPVPVLGR